MKDASTKGCAVCGEVYQVVGALRDSANTPALEPVLDNLSASARGEPVPHSSVLPFDAQSQMAQLISEIDELCFDEASGGYFWPESIHPSVLKEITDKYRSTK